jgi:hypothetical protein
VEHARGFAVHDLRRADDLAAEGLADGLVAQTHAKDGHLAGQLGQHLERNSGLVRRAWTR